jgi:hypothetical protein
MTKQLTLTQAAASKYLTSGGIDCPYCGGEDTVVQDLVNCESGVAECKCSHCEREWIELWRMYGIQESGEYDTAGKMMFTIKEDKCRIMVTESMENEMQQNSYLVAILFSPGNKTSAIILESDDPTDLITSEDYDEFMEYCKEQAKLWQCELQVNVKKEDYFTDGDE